MTPPDTPSTTDEVVLERTFAAAPERVWEMWTDRARFASWYGPGGAEVEVHELDLRVGGTRHVRMVFTTPDGSMAMSFVGEHLEIDPPHRLVYTEATADAEGTPTSPTTRVVVELAPSDGGTRLVLRHVGVPADSPGAAGWSMALDELGAALAG